MLYKILVMSEETTPRIPVEPAVEKTPLETKADAKPAVPPPVNPPEEPAKPKPAELFSAQSDNYTAWVTQNGEAAYQGNLDIKRDNGVSSYIYTGATPEECKQILLYNIRNLKL